MGPEKTVDGSGLNATDQHSTSGEQMWLSAKGDAQPWIQYEFDKAYRLDKMLVWNSNQPIEAMIGFGAKAVKIECSLDGQTWTALGDFEFARASGAGDLHGQYDGRFRRRRRQVRETDDQQQLGRHRPAVRSERSPLLPDPDRGRA